MATLTDSEKRKKAISLYQLEKLVNHIDDTFAPLGNQADQVNIIDLEFIVDSDDKKFVYDNAANYQYNGSYTTKREYNDETNSVDYAIFKVLDADLYLVFTIADDGETYTYSVTYSAEELPDEMAELFEVGSYAVVHRLSATKSDTFYPNKVSAFVESDGTPVSGFIRYEDDGTGLIGTEGTYFIILSLDKTKVYVYKYVSTRGWYRYSTGYKEGEGTVAVQATFKALRSLVCCSGNYEADVTYPDGTIGSQLTQLAQKLDGVSGTSEYQRMINQVLNIQSTAAEAATYYFELGTADTKNGVEVDNVTGERLRTGLIPIPSNLKITIHFQNTTFYNQICLLYYNEDSYLGYDEFNLSSIVNAESEYIINPVDALATHVRFMIVCSGQTEATAILNWVEVGEGASVYTSKKIAELENTIEENDALVEELSSKMDDLYGKAEEKYGLINVTSEVTFVSGFCIWADETDESKLGQRISSSSGIFAASDYYALDEAKSIVITMPARSDVNVSVGIAFYSEQSESSYVSSERVLGEGNNGTYIYVTKQYDVPTGAKYIRCTGINGISNFSLSVYKLKSEYTSGRMYNAEKSIALLKKLLDADDTPEVDLDSITSEEMYALWDDLVAKYPNYISCETLGKDSSGEHDIKEYAITQRNKYAYLYADRAYAWKNGDTILYSASITPRIGDTLYSDQLKTASGYTVTASDCTVPSITVGDTVYSRDESSDLDIDVVYLTTGDSSTTTSNSKTYTRKPNYDYSSLRKCTIFTNCNDHGPGQEGDPREPSYALYRIVEKLCGNCEDNPKYNWLKKYAKIVVIPVTNPYAYNEELSTYVVNNKEEKGRVNANKVNINRNYPVKTWFQDTEPSGTYGGSETETQYIINSAKRHYADYGISCHCLGPLALNYGQWYHEGQTSSMLPAETELDILATYNLKYTALGIGGNYGKAGRWYYEQGMKGGLVEMNQGYDDTLHSNHIVEADMKIWFSILDCYNLFDS